MRVHLRKKKLTSGAESLFLHYYINGDSVKEYLDIHVHKKSADFKEKMILAESIRSKKEMDLTYGSFGMISPRNKKADMLVYFKVYCDNYTKKDYRKPDSVLKNLKKFYTKPVLPATLVTESFCQKFRDYLISKHRGATSVSYFSTFRRIIRQATKEGIFLKDPTAEIKNKNASDGQLTKEVLSFDEINLLSKTRCPNEEVKRAFLFSCFTGFRGSDIRTLTWKNIDLKQKCVRIEQNKTDKQNFLPLSSTAITLLGKEGSGHVFALPSINGTNKDIKAWVNKAGIKKHITFHCARHSLATNLLITGNDLVTVSKVMGHASTNHTIKYTHISDKMKRKAVDALPGLIYSPSPDHQ